MHLKVILAVAEMVLAAQAILPQEGVAALAKLV
jgi:hypothetical protein